MKLSVKIIDIGTRGVLLHRADARDIGVLDGDRVDVTNNMTGVSVTAFVTTTSTLLANIIMVPANKEYFVKGNVNSSENC
jgi:anaerobic selenocysteine-containing dehydrogenase